MPAVVLPAGNNTYTPTPADADYTITQIPPSDGNNTVTLGNGTDGITFADGNNTLSLGDGADQINLGNGGNTVTSGNGNSQVTVGNGNDTITVGTGSNAIVLGTGIDTASTKAGNNTVSVAGTALTGDTIHGALSTLDGTTNTLVMTTPGPAMSPASVYGFQTYQLANGGPNGLTLSEANFTNLPQGSITVTGGASGNTINAGSLSAAHSVVIYGGAGTDLLTGGAGNDRFIFAPSNLSGDTVSGAAGTNTLELQAGAGVGTVNGLGGTNLSGLQVVDVDAGADWLFTSTQAATDTINLAGGAVAEFAGAVPSGQTIAFTGATGTLEIDSATQFAGTIVGFQAGDTIDLTGVAFAAGGTASLGAGNVLHVAENGQTYNLQLDPNQNFTGTQFALSADSANGTDIAQSPNPVSGPGWNVVGVGDTNGDGFADIIWQNQNSNAVDVQLLNGTTTLSEGPIANTSFGSDWSAVATGDFNGDGKTDLVYRQSDSGTTEIQFLNGLQGVGGGALSYNPFDTSWNIVATGDFTGNGESDLVWQQASSGAAEIQLLNGVTSEGGGAIANSPFSGTDWKIITTGDFNGTGKDGLVWQSQSTGVVELQFLNGNTAAGGGAIPNSPFGAEWKVVGAGDFQGNGFDDLVYQSQSDGAVEIQFLKGTTAGGGGAVSNELGAAWQVAGVGDFNGDGKADLLYHNTATGATQLQFLNGTTVIGGGMI